MPTTTVTFSISGSIRIPSAISNLPPNVVIRPDNAVVSLVGRASGVSRFAVPASGALSLQGAAPTALLVLKGAVPVAAGTALVAGYAPSTAAPAGVLRQPGAGSVTVTPYAIQVPKINYVLQTDVGQINYVPWPPTLVRGSGAAGSATSIQPDSGAVVTPGLVPTLTISSSSSTASVSAGAVPLTGLAPSRILGTVIQPGAGAVGATGAAPGILSASSDPYFSNVDLLLLFREGAGATTFIDSSSNARTITRNGSVTGSATTNPFGYASCVSFPGGAGNFLDSAIASLNPSSTTPWTIELWVNLTSAQRSSSATLAGFGASGGNLYWEAYTTWASTYVGDGSTNAVSGATMGSASDVWKHYAITNDGSGTTSAYRVYYDGNKIATSSTVLTSGTQTNLRIGQGNTLTFSGLMSGFRYTKGVARYTGTTYTVPTAEFPTS